VSSTDVVDNYCIKVNVAQLLAVILSVIQAVGCSARGVNITKSCRNSFADFGLIHISRWLCYIMNLNIYVPFV
jgi:hypothetical protein